MGKVMGWLSLYPVENYICLIMFEMQIRNYWKSYENFAGTDGTKFAPLLHICFGGNLAGEEEKSK